MYENEEVRSKHMKRGITVDILDGYDNLLWKVLKPIDITAFDWQAMGRKLI